ncbi:putative clathrin assembly protein At4g40080 [Humulus lupulus]|uniref:putative clathrin assembly protein At4g40080 n=1 Tax=Humulus lupulus TaxID=3486 RepID=UPI002B40CEB2|nr:putative clathrin assembly protein At4g40080 [Humulus lupulus]
MGIMIGRKKLRNLIGIIKDKASLTKAITLSTSRHASSIRVTIICATTHEPSSPPSENHISAVIGGGGQESRSISSTCINTLMGRLHATRSAAVALKCLLVAHNIVSRGSFILKDQLSFYPSSGGPNFLNLSTFRDKSDNDTWQMSSWVRWYAAVVEQNLMVSRVMGYYLCNNSSNSDHNNNKVLALSSWEVLSEVDALVDYVECTRDAPDSFKNATNDLIYDVLEMVGKDYRLVQRELSVRVKEFGDRIQGLNSSELTRFLEGLKRLEDGKESLLSLFKKRRSDDEFWDLISQVKMRILEMVKKREQEKRLMITWVGGEDPLQRKSTRLSVRREALFRLPSSGGWSSSLGLTPVSL